MATRPKAGGRALFYTRDSGGEHENTPAEYVRWAQRTAIDHGAVFTGTPEQIEQMIRGNKAVEGDLFVDFKVKGHLLSRPALDAFLRTAETDPTVSIVLIPRRDRLARPENPTDGLALEARLRRAGVTLAFMDLVLKPTGHGRTNFAEMIVGLIDYDRAGQERRDLAQKILYAHLKLARDGYSTGGRPPYGFRRWLVHEAGQKIRQLADGEVVRMAHHHVIWLPSGEEREWALINRIIDLLLTTPASQVARLLTEEGVPTPDQGRFRTDNGIAHPTSGAWSQTSVVNIARNPLLRLVVEYGRRSMGDQLRFNPTQPRELTDTDLRYDQKPKVVTNEPALRVTAPVRFEPPVDLGKVQKLNTVLDTRGETQRGKSRSRDPGRNPLGTRAFDLNCGWPLYRTPYNGSFRYCCGLYQQSHGAKCSHNTVDGPTATRFLLACVRQRLFAPAFRDKVQAKLKAIAARECGTDGGVDRERMALEREFSEVRGQREQAAQNMAKAKTDAQFEAMSKVFDQLVAQEQKLAEQLRVALPSVLRDPGAEVEAALSLLDRLSEVTNDGENLPEVGRLFAGVNTRLFLRFGESNWGNRKVNKVIGGVVTFGATAPPVKLYEGPTGRRALKSRTYEHGTECEGLSALAPGPIGAGQEGDSLGNVNRADRIRTCDLLIPKPAIRFATRW